MLFLMKMIFIYKLLCLELMTYAIQVVFQDWMVLCNLELNQAVPLNRKF